MSTKFSRVDYSDAATWTSPNGCPRLFLAPMEGIGDHFFRKAYALIGGYDESCTEFLRVPGNPHIPSLSKRYNPLELFPNPPTAVQIMGQEPGFMADMTAALVERGAPRIDLNCGCPSNTVVGHGAGSNLLKTPELLYRIAKAMVSASTVPVSIKLRSGFDDTSLFKENLLAAQESGAVFLTLHARTKKDGYTAPANWDLIAQAKELLKIPLVGNGDIITPQDAQKMHAACRCDGLMIGRGAVRNPWIFHDIRSAFEGVPSRRNWSQTEAYLQCYFNSVREILEERNCINKLKSIINFLFQNEGLKDRLRSFLTSKYSADEFFFKMLLDIKSLYN